MSKLNLTQAAKAAGISRTTLYRHIEKGKVTCEVNKEGQKIIDVSELIRVYGEIKNPDTPTERTTERPSGQSGTVEVVQVLQDRVRDLEERVEELKQDKKELLTILKQQTLLLPAGTDEAAEEEIVKRNTKKETSKKRKNSKKKGFFGRLFGGK